MNVERELEGIRQSLELGRHTSAARDCCVVIEQALRELLKRNLFGLEGKAQMEVQKAVLEHGKGKPIDDMGMGELVGAVRGSKFIHHLAQAWGRELHGLKHLQWNLLVDARNKLSHGKWEATRPEAMMLYATLEVIIESLGLAVIGGDVQPNLRGDSFSAASVQEPTIAVGEGALEPWAFEQGYEWNREHLGAPLESVRPRRAGDGSFEFFTQAFAPPEGKGRFLLAWRVSFERAYCVRHGMAHVYQREGMMASLGVPTCDEYAVRSSTGVRAAVQDFEVGEKPWLKRRLCYHLDGTMKGQAYQTRGGIHVHYLRHGAEASRLGLPVSDEISDRQGAFSRFEGGMIRWSKLTNKTSVEYLNR